MTVIPVFALTGQEGTFSTPRLHRDLRHGWVNHPLRYIGPVLCSLLIGGRIRGEEANPMMRALI